MRLRVYPQIHSNENWWRPPKSLHGRAKAGTANPTFGNPAGTRAGEDYQRWKQAALMEHDVRVRRALDDGLVDSAVDRSRWSSSVISWKSCCRATISASQFCAMLRNSAGFVAGAAIPHDKAAPHGAQSGHVNGFAHGIPQTAGAGAASLLVFHLHQTAWPKRLCG